jgi:hypothetical protein
MPVRAGAGGGSAFALVERDGYRLSWLDIEPNKRAQDPAFPF